MAGLDQTVAQRVLTKIRWLAENLNVITPIRLTGKLRNICKLRVGDWRVFYEYQADADRMVIRAVGNRREVYRPHR